MLYIVHIYLNYDIDNGYASPATECHMQQIPNFLLVVHNKSILKPQYTDKGDAVTSVTAV